MESFNVTRASLLEGGAARRLPRVSVVIPVYNCRRYVATAIQSIRSQSFDDLEVILVDDGSTDGSAGVMNRAAGEDDRIRIVRCRNTGIVGALNAGVAACSGEFIARMDADDIALVDRLAVQMNYLADHIDCVALGTAVLLTDPEGRALKTYSPREGHSDIEEDLANGNGGAIVHPTVIFRREALIRCGGYRQRYNFIEDLDIFVRLLDFGRLANLPDVLLHYRQHSRSVNHVVRNRWDQIAEIIAPLRKKKGLKELTPSTLSESSRIVSGAGAFRRKWALDAAEGNNRAAARANALLAVSQGPWCRSNWSCLRYVLSLQDRRTQ